MNASRLATIGMALLIMATAGLTSAAEQPMAIASAAANKIAKKTNIEQVSIEDAEPNRFKLYLVYKEKPGVSLSTAKADTEAVARDILKQLVANGRKPGSDDMVFIHIHAVQVAQGETRKGYSPRGSTSYDFNTDRLVFKAP